MADRTESTVTIDAPPEAVLAVIADFEQYPSWATEVRDVEVLSHEGDGWPDRVRFVLDAGVIKDTYVLDYEWNITESGTGVVSWDLVEATTLRSLQGSYALEEENEGTRVTYRLTVDVAIPMLGMVKRKAERMIVDTALKNLKGRIESDL